MLVLMLTSCRLGVSVFEGGDVISASTERHCFEGGTCEFAIDDPLFTETFTATPRYGYEFTRWRAGEGFLCGGSTDPVCDITLDGSALSQAVVSSGHMGYLMPEFACTAVCPERPNFDEWHWLVEATDAMAEAREAVSAYVATNGEGASSPALYGVTLGLRNSWWLSHLDFLPENTSLSAGTNHTFYIIANVYPWWQDSGPWPVKSFALSGHTNSDDTMEWTCIPRHPEDEYIPNGPDAIPEWLLPFECRG